MPMWRRRFLTAVGGLLLALAAYELWYWTHGLKPGAETYYFKQGTTLRGVAGELKRRGVLPETRSLVWGATLTGQGRKLKAGEYRFADGISPRALLAQMIAGKVVEYPLRFVEGWTFAQMRQAMQAAPRLTRTLNGLPDREIMMRLGYPGLHPEGRFYPDTYYYTTDQPDHTILAKAFEKMRERLAREWEGREDGLPFKSLDEALTLASIVEKETGKAEERPLIAGVFINRLRKGMKLQTDPTVIYGMGKSFDGNLRLRDLKKDTPYNTYTRVGLPPTPIAMPGGDAVRAVLHPAKTRALYFVSRGDGSHYFSETLEEHNKAVVQYQLGGKPPAKR
ncbi:MAG: endolytic transglycosylase MltG [Gammaproteobacteria bacterium]|nr:MAG: endolytic transglycosylase MltG [Gammaproteobacteria bacterium]